MRVKISSIVKLIIFVTIVSALSLLKPLGELFPVFYFEYAVRWGIVLLAATANVFLIYGKRITNKYLVITVIFLSGLVLMRLCMDFFCGRNVYKELNANVTYFFVLLAIPVYYLLKDQIIRLSGLVDILIFLTVLSYGLRIFISAYYTLFHQRIFLPISIESATENWFRNDVLRVNPPCFGIIIITLCIYRFYSVKTMKRKIYYSFVAALAIFYSAYIHYSRAALIFQICEVAFLILIKRKSILKQTALYVLIGTAVVILLNKGIIDKLSYMFSTDNAEYWFSNSSRLISYPYYFNMFLSNFWLGKGFLRGEELYFEIDHITGALSDVGILRSLVQLGCGMLFFYLSFFMRCILTAAKLHKRKVEDLELLVWGILLSFVLTGINIDCFFAIYVFSVPFCLAIVEYAREYQ